MQLEERDWKILALLQHDARLSNQDLAEQVGMSASSCWRRVRMLEEAGIIRRYTAELDARRAGFGFHAIVHVQLARHARETVEQFVAEVMRHDEVQDCFATSGAADYHLRVLCRDLDAYNDFMERFLFRLEGITNVQTNLVLRHIKSQSRLRP